MRLPLGLVALLFFGACVVARHNVPVLGTLLSTAQWDMVVVALFVCLTVLSGYLCYLRGRVLRGTHNLVKIKTKLDQLDALWNRRN